MSSHQKAAVLWCCSITLVIGMFMGEAIINCTIHNIAIKNNIAHYNSTNGNFQWNFETNK